MPDTLRCLSLWQPFASLIAIGAKRTETRSWGTSYRGWVLIHAAKKCDQDVQDDIRAAMRLLESRRFEAPTPEQQAAANLPWKKLLGVVVAIGWMAECKPAPQPPSDPLDAAFGNYGPGRWGWRLEQVRPLPEPIPMRGMQGLFGVDRAIAQEVWAAIGKEIVPPGGVLQQNLFPEDRHA